MNELIFISGIILILNSLVSYIVNRKKYSVEKIEVLHLFMLIGISLQPLVKGGFEAWTSSLLVLVFFMTLFVIIPFRSYGISRQINVHYSLLIEKFDKHKLFELEKSTVLREGKTYQFHNGVKVWVLKSHGRSKTKFSISSGFDLRRILKARREFMPLLIKVDSRMYNSNEMIFGVFYGVLLIICSLFA